MLAEIPTSFAGIESLFAILALDLWVSLDSLYSSEFHFSWSVIPLQQVSYSGLAFYLS